MQVTVTVDLFSGRKNPVVKLKGKSAKEAVERLTARKSLEWGDPGLPKDPVLGYRGMVIDIEGNDKGNTPNFFRLAGSEGFVGNQAFQVEDKGFEDFIFDQDEFYESIGRKKNNRDRVEQLREDLKELRRFYPWDLPIVIPTLVTPCTCGTLYEPNWWNVPAIQPYNNCYNYACNYRTDTFAQPGRASGQMYSALTCASVRPAAVRDDLVDNPGANNNCPQTGNLVALVIDPGWDFHWYRKDKSGWWSHKPGGTAVTNRDNSGNFISDPRTANRGGYTDFCTFMTVHPGHIKIN